MQQQIDPGRQRVESTPRSNLELQVQEQVPTPEKGAGHMQRQCRGGEAAHRWLQPPGPGHGTETSGGSTAGAICKPE